MAKYNIQAIRGMKDYLPTDMPLWQQIEATLKNILARYGYREIRLPIVEYTTLFQRAIGKVTDVVEKEMYTFHNRHGERITLRPEGTAGCVRAGIEHGLFYNNEQRWWYAGPMFRYERPQKGRYRQFHQIGAEVFGPPGPDIEAELILLTTRWWHTLGISEYLSLQINSIGSLACRNSYRTALVAFLHLHASDLDNDSRRRMHTNPMRIFDSKNPVIQNLLNDAPVITDYLDDESNKHFTNLCQLLDLVGISYHINPCLVRGLDYYNRTVFEWVTNNLNSRLQATVCGGGRYDGLVQQLGGHPTPAVGLAIGLERLVLLMQIVKPNFISLAPIDVYFIAVGNNIEHLALLIAEQLRDAVPNIRLMINHGGGSVKNQFSRADKQGAKIALVLGEREVRKQQIVVKNLVTGYQETIAQCDVIAKLVSIFH